MDSGRACKVRTRAQAAEGLQRLKVSSDLVGERGKHRVRMWKECGRLSIWFHRWSVSRGTVARCPSRCSRTNAVSHRVNKTHRAIGRSTIDVGQKYDPSSRNQERRGDYQPLVGGKGRAGSGNLETTSGVFFQTRANHLGVSARALPDRSLQERNSLGARFQQSNPTVGSQE